MKKTAEALQTLELTVGRYLAELEQLDMEQLLAKPSEEEWSIGQMVVHLIQSAELMHLRNVDRCLAGDEAALGNVAEKTEPGRTAFELGSYPSIRIKVPASPQYTPRQPESKEQLAEGLRGVLERMKRTEVKLSQADERYTLPHPGFGALNATEWFLLVDMHYRHHWSQLERLREFLRQPQS
ncbi:DinB family protein [Paenibacillus xanthanilyticus]|uniref:DinB family protein n=1 Tax=Paenibacillus xanthanilyticus TaxID=1783531 RepID=A0ABV8K9C1_9BACL